MALFFSVSYFLPIFQGWRTFLRVGSNIRSQTDKRKNVGQGCNDIDDGLEPGKQKIKYKRSSRLSMFPIPPKSKRRARKKGLRLINFKLSESGLLGVNSK